MIKPTLPPGPFSVSRYFEMAQCGILAPDDRVELLDGLIVSMAPASPPHDSAITRVQYALIRRLGFDVVVRVQMSFLAGPRSAPQPDIAVVPGTIEDYDRRHPTKAHLIVEVSESSLTQDRVSKAAIYARAAVPCYWIVNLRTRCVEVFREPDRWKGRYEVVTTATGDEPLAIDAFPGIAITAGELLPPPVGDEER